MGCNCVVPGLMVVGVEVVSSSSGRWIHVPLSDVGEVDEKA